MKMNLMDGFVSLFFPRRCPICDEPVKLFGTKVCTTCLPRIRYVSGATCFKCGKPLAHVEDEYCEDCSVRKHLYIKGFPLFEYKSVSDSIYRFKYKGRREYAAWYGEQIATHLGEKIKALGVDALIPVPIHKSKLQIRGYNQATLLANEISKQLGVPVVDNCVRRVKKTTPLKDLTPEERNNILRGAFKLNVDDVKLRTIVIIDDIYTTGATIDAVALPLLNAGVSNIYFISLAIGKGI